MILTAKVKTKDFQKALEIMQFAMNNQTKNISNGLYMKVSKEESAIKLESNNYTIQMKMEIKASDIMTGEIEEINIHAPQLLNVIRTIQSPFVTLNLIPEINRLKIFTDHEENRNTYFPIRPANEFPKMERGALETIAKVKIGTLTKLLKDVSFAASTDKNKYALNSVSLTFDKTAGIIDAGATDSYQMAMESEKITEEEWIENENALIPIDIITELIKLLKEKEPSDFVELSKNPNKTKIEFKIGETDTIYFRAPLIINDYPALRNYAKELPEPKIVIETKQLKKAIDFVTPVSAETEYNTIHLNFDEKDNMTVYVNSETGISSTNIPCANSEKKQINMLFDCKKINKWIKQMESETILVQLNPKAMQVYIPENKTFIYLLAPMRPKK